jgi:predicted permease
MNRRTIRESLLRFAALFHLRRAERDMADELEFHVAMKQQKYMRERLLRQLLTESMLLAFAGTTLGLAAAPFLAQLLGLFLRSPQEALHPPLDVAPDLRVVLFTIVVAVVVTLLTGTAPALRSTGRELQQRMRQGSAAIKGAERRHHWWHLILACEVALALVLVTGASLLGDSLVRLHKVPTGFEPTGLVLMPLEVEKQTRDGKALIQAYRDISGRLAALPGVERVSFVNMPPLMGNWWAGDIAVVGHEKHELFRNQAGPNYFRAMRTPLLAGREFRWSDSDESTRVVILNQAAERGLFPNGNPLGQRLTVGDDKTIAEVVGIVGDAKYQNMRDTAPPTVYSSFAQDVKNKPSYTIPIRVTAPPASVISAARAVVRRVMPDIPPPVAMTMEQTIAEHLVTERMMASLALFFAGVGLLITAIGLYGTLAYATARRAGEIGIRFALGAQRGDVIGMVCRENGIVALGGCLLGLSASLGRPNSSPASCSARHLKIR